MTPIFFPSSSEFHLWIKEHHNISTEILLGFHKKSTKKDGLTYFEALDEALCFGWIDAVRRNIDAYSYCIRFTPRKPKSIWSNVNIKKVEVLTAAGRMQAAGLTAFALREEKRSGIYFFEQEKAAELSPEFLKIFKANKKAWAFFQAQAPYYIRQLTHRITAAKRPETQLKRLNQLIEYSENGRRLD